MGSCEILTGDIKYRAVYIVNNTVTTIYGAKWVLEISGGTLCKVHDCLTAMLCARN